MGRASQKFDRQLFTLKLSELSRQMQVHRKQNKRRGAAASELLCGGDSLGC
jgi:hypothetical protein